MPVGGDEGDVNAEEQAEEKEIAAAFPQKRKYALPRPGSRFMEFGDGVFI